RRLMYWQVYLHKTSLVAEQLLMRVLQRAKELVLKGEKLEASRALTYFLENDISATKFDQSVLKIFSELDEYDIVSTMKTWQYHSDFVLSNLCEMVINRNLLKIKIKKNPIKKDTFKKHIESLIDKYNISEQEAGYFVFSGSISNQAYQL